MKQRAEETKILSLIKFQKLTSHTQERRDQQFPSSTTEQFEEEHAIDKGKYNPGKYLANFYDPLGAGLNFRILLQRSSGPTYQLFSLDRN